MTLNGPLQCKQSTDCSMTLHLDSTGFTCQSDRIASGPAPYDNVGVSASGAVNNDWVILSAGRLVIAGTHHDGSLAVCADCECGHGLDLVIQFDVETEKPACQGRSS